MAPRVGTREEAVAALVELFRTHGYDGLSLSRMTAATGLGRGSLFNYFPGGKEEMAGAALDHIERWFETEVFAPLRAAPTTDAAVRGMLDAVDAYFHAGRRACLVAVFALDHRPNRFGAAIRRYFRAWLAALTDACARSAASRLEAAEAAERILAAIQGGLLLALALDDPAHFGRTLGRLRDEWGAGAVR